MNITEIQKQFELNIRNFDYVEYGGSQNWKPKRTFKGFPYSHKDLGISLAKFRALKKMQREVWLFMDTLLLDNAQNDGEHILDYCFFGQRMGWKVNDEIWLVFNIACNRFELRYPDPQKWDPLEKLYVNEDLTIHVKLGYIWRRKNANFFNAKNKIGYIQTLSVNGFPDRIELNLTCISKDKHFEAIDQIFEYYLESENSCANMLKIYESISCITSNSFKFNQELNNQIQNFKKNHFPQKIYNIKDQTEQNPNDYWKTFITYSHQLKFWQQKNKKKKK